MRLVTIADSKGGRPGLIVSGRIFDLRVGHPSLELSRWRPESVVAILDAGEEGLDYLRRLHGTLLDAHDDPELAPAWLDLKGTALGPPIRRPGLLLSVHFDSTDGWVPLIKSPHALAGPDQPITASSHGGASLVVRGQLALVIGRRCHRANADQGEAGIGGYTLALDVNHDSVPAGDRREKLWTRYLGAQQPGFFPLGPAVAVQEALDPEQPLQVTVNGVTGEQWVPSRLPLSAAETVATVSNYFALKPGDVIAVGAPRSVGVTVSPGDALAVEHDALGCLTTALAA